MEHNNLEKSEKQTEIEHHGQKTSGISTWYLVGGAALVLATAVLFSSLPDLKRYIKISTM